ncbi:MAG: hypothetical protein MZV65_48520 [Chromatiales bacterium]|nr:hypothetical protein [Chromatiales bacterium]
MINYILLGRRLGLHAGGRTARPSLPPEVLRFWPAGRWCITAAGCAGRAPRR